ncbi:hypothetical protein LBBP_01856 [Leptospira borgpetersenii serovar Ballum]|uniref:Uncharacterized protein n=1 Tax=Leptospira borgpetersenii serovar Ballum TaxID=280505 RepID=A0A0S2IR42_LEPBO|nr:hypothetical protein LBBP_01856 [Leptospira borgpetersenii serovar Ballum]
MVFERENLRIVSVFYSLPQFLFQADGQENVWNPLKNFKSL